MDDVTPTTSSKLAQLLHRAGIATVPSRTREGVYVTGGDPNRRATLSVSVQIDGDQDNADEWARMISDALNSNGLVFEHKQDADGYHRFTVHGRPKKGS